MVRLHGALDVFVGQPLTCDRPELFIQVTQTGESTWAVEIHNPTDQAIRATLKKNPEFDPLRQAKLDDAIDVPAGASVFRGCTP